MSKIKTYKHGKYHGKYFHWPNGLRFKVLGPDPKYPDSSVEVECPTTGRKFSIGAEKLKDEEIISEEEAKKQWAKVEVGTGWGGFCSCCSWKVGKPQLRLFLDLQQGKMPGNETDRVQTALREFFKSFGSYVPYVHPTDTGVEIEFYAAENETTRERHKKYKDAVAKGRHDIGTCDPENCAYCKEAAA